ncbi:MAG: class I SAM-dependent methyltransferase [Negativicutes bacterium]|nr:class I SAM-dependent methyltransferase [Negativicutes bacterium]
MSLTDSEQKEHKSIWIGQEIQASKASFYNHYIASHLRPHMGKKILEIGVGIGNITEALIKNVESYIGIDAVEEHIQVASERFKNYPFKGFTLSVDNCASLNMISKEEVDTIISVNCFEHIENDESVMSWIYNWAKPGTHFIFLVPAHQLLYSGLDIQGEHFRRYNKKLMKDRIQHTGFFLEGMRYINLIGAIAWFLVGKCSRNHKPVRHDQISTAWKVMYSLLPLARYPLMLQQKLETICQVPAGLSLIVWGKKQGNNE